MAWVWVGWVPSWELGLGWEWVMGSELESGLGWEWVLGGRWGQDVCLQSGIVRLKRRELEVVVVGEGMNVTMSELWLVESLNGGRRCYWTVGN